MRVNNFIVELGGNQNRLNRQKRIETGENNHEKIYIYICVNSAEISDRHVNCIRHLINIFL